MQVDSERTTCVRTSDTPHKCHMRRCCRSRPFISGCTFVSQGTRKEECRQSYRVTLKFPSVFLHMMYALKCHVEFHSTGLIMINSPNAVPYLKWDLSAINMIVTWYQRLERSLPGNCLIMMPYQLYPFTGIFMCENWK